MSEDSKSAFEVIWRIEGIKSWLEIRRDSIYSPPFLAETLINTRWKLRLSPNWQLAEKYASLTLQRDVDDDHPDVIGLNYELLFLSADGKPLKSKKLFNYFAQKSVSSRLNVKLDVILDEKNGAYMSEDVLTVCCKLWMKSTVSKEGYCSLRSSIGIKNITLKETIHHFDVPFVLPVNFMPHSKDISQISLNVYASKNEFIFERKHIECKSLSWYSCKLFALNGKLYKTEFDEKFNLTEESLPSKSAAKLQSISTSDFFSHYFRHGALTLQLEISYYPGIISECVESKSNMELLGRDGDLQNLNAPDSELFHNLSDSSNDGRDDNDSNYKDAAASNYEEDDYPNYEDDDSNYEDDDSNYEDDDSNYEDDNSNYEDDNSNYEDDNSNYEDEGDLNDKKSNIKDELKIEDKYPCIAGKKNLLLGDFESLYNANLFCDTKICTNTEIFPAHKIILSARSPVFKKMFTTEMKEKAGESVYVPDMSSDTMKRMLQFIYTDCPGNLEMQSAKDLYVAADKYDIAPLKKYCSSFMKNNLCISNVCEVLILSDIHRDQELESAAREFVFRNHEKVFGSVEWELFMKNSSGLALAIMYLKCTKE